MRMNEQFSYNVIFVESRNIFILSTIDGICWKSNYVVRECETNAELWFVFGKINFVCVDGCELNCFVFVTNEVLLRSLVIAAVTLGIHRRLTSTC